MKRFLDQKKVPAKMREFEMFHEQNDGSHDWVAEARKYLTSYV